MLSSFLWRSSRRYLLKHPVLIGLAILGVALGVAVVVGIDLANTSALKAFQLSSESVTGKATHQIVGSTESLDEDIYRKVRVEAGLRESAPVVEGYAVASGPNSQTLRVLGIDLFSEEPFRSFTGSLQSSLDLALFISGGNTGVLSDQTASDLQTFEGDALDVIVDGVSKSVSIIGTISPSEKLTEASIDNLLLVDIATAQQLLGAVGKLSRIDLILENETSKQQISILQSYLPQGVEIRRSESRSDAIDQMTRAFSLNLTALSLLALVVGMFLVYNTVTFSVVQRRSLIGRFRALGVTRSEIFKLILLEAAAVGIIGTSIGLMMGIALGKGMVGLVSQTINDLYFVVNVRELNFSALTFAKGIALGIGATLVATIAPAREATSAPASTVLRRSNEESRVNAFLPKLAFSGVACGVLALVLLMLPGKSIVVSYAALLFVLIAFALITPGAVVIFARLVRSMTRNIIGRMAARGVVSSLSRTSVAIAALMVAIAATIGVGVMVDSFRTTVEVWLGYTLQADVYISPPSEVFRRNDATIDPAAERAIRSVSGVEGVYSVRSTRITVADKQHDLVVIDPGPRTPNTFQLKSVDADDIWDQFASADVVLVSEPYSYRFNSRPGDVLPISTDYGTTPFNVGAIYYDYASDLGTILMSRQTYERHFNDRGISGLALYALGGENIDSLIASIQTAVGERQALFIRSNRDLREASLEVFDRTFTITIVLRLLAVFIAFVGVLSALMALQLEKGRELAILRANGLTPTQVWSYVTRQTGLMGVMAGLFSIPLGLLLAYILIFVINQRSFGWTLQISIDPAILFQAVLLAIAAALLAGVYPALKMSKANPAHAIRDE